MSELPVPYDQTVLENKGVYPDRYRVTYPEEPVLWLGTKPPPMDQDHGRPGDFIIISNQ